jgi:hypothetical protein
MIRFPSVTLLYIYKSKKRKEMPPIINYNTTNVNLLTDSHDAHFITAGRRTTLLVAGTVVVSQAQDTTTQAHFV